MSDNETAGRYDATEAARLAQNIARNLGWPVFPCSRETKRPTRPKAEGGRGYKDATTDPDGIADLWRHWPGALIGVPTGPLSGISVLDVDVKHDTARAWWVANEIRLPTTRTYRTRGGGLHLYFNHAPGVRNVEGRPIQGVDVRGEGGYIIFWFAAGCECVDPAPPAPWPHWLTPLFWPPAPTTSRRREVSAESGGPNNDALIRTVREAREGERNGKLFWAANRMREAGASRGDAERHLLPAAQDAGLPEIEARRTLASAWGVA